MRKPTFNTLAMMAAAWLAFGQASLRADDPQATGIIRITDQSAPGMAPRFAASSMAAATSTAAVPDAAFAGSWAHCPEGKHCPSLKHGGWKPWHLARWVYDPHACFHSGSHGWARPGKFPVARVPVHYHRFWPQRFAGEPGFGMWPLFPMVYMPTDTTELGFYYQRVPYWHPIPGMVPPPPAPPSWVARECPTHVLGGPAGWGDGSVLLSVDSVPANVEFSSSPSESPGTTPSDLQRSARR